MSAVNKIWVLAILFFSISGCSSKKTIAWKEDVTYVICEKRNGFFALKVEAKKIKDDLYWMIDIRQNIYFDRVSEYSKDSELAVILENSLIDKNDASKFELTFKDKDGYLVSWCYFTSDLLKKNEGNQWGYHYRSKEKLDGESIKRITDVDFKVNYNKTIQYVASQLEYKQILSNKQIYMKGEDLEYVTKKLSMPE
jgi:hypothetical protein